MCVGQCEVWATDIQWVKVSRNTSGLRVYLICKAAWVDSCFSHSHELKDQEVYPQKALLTLALMLTLMSLCNVLHANLFLFAVDDHQVCPSLLTMFSTLPPGLLDGRNVVETGWEIHPSILEILICHG